MIKKFELLDEDGYTYRATVLYRPAPAWKFWDRKTVTDVFIGNSLGWYSMETGAKLARKEITQELADLMRKDFLKKQYGQKKPSHLTPIK